MQKQLARRFSFFGMLGVAMILLSGCTANETPSAQLNGENTSIENVQPTPDEAIEQAPAIDPDTTKIFKENETDPEVQQESLEVPPV